LYVLINLAGIRPFGLNGYAADLMCLVTYILFKLGFFYLVLFPQYTSDSIQYCESFILYLQVEKAHSGDVHCVDWNPLDANYILTGYNEEA
jgi:hypothetical protein